MAEFEPFREYAYPEFTPYRPYQYQPHQQLLQEYTAYQQEYAAYQQYQQEMQEPSIEDLLMEFIKQNRELMNMQIQTRSLVASLKRLEVQVDQIAEILNERPQENHPSNIDQPQAWSVSVAKESIEIDEEIEICEEKKIEKKNDPGDFIIEVKIGEETDVKGILDLGADVNLMPSNIYQQLNLGGIKSVSKEISFADGSTKQIRGILEDQVVLIDEYKIPVDFLVIDVEKPPWKNNEILFGKPFMATVGAEIDVRGRGVKMRLFDEVIEFEGERGSNLLKRVFKEKIELRRRKKSMNYQPP